MIFRILADLTVAAHFAYVSFVILSLFVTLAGGFLGWQWVRNRWFRGIHLTLILIVVFEAWLGITCPLTTLEREFRSAAGDQTYQGDFLANLIHDMMFFHADPWVFTTAYSCFGAIVLATMFCFPPRWNFSRKRHLKF